MYGGFCQAVRRGFTVLDKFICTTTSCKSTWDTVPYFGINGLSMILCLWSPSLIKVSSNTRPYSKLGGTTLNGREGGGQYYISQTCDQERFAARKVVFSCVSTFWKLVVACTSPQVISTSPKTLFYWQDWLHFFCNWNFPQKTALARQAS